MVCSTMGRKLAESVCSIAGSLVSTPSLSERGELKAKRRAEGPPYCRPASGRRTQPDERSKRTRIMGRGEFPRPFFLVAGP